MIPTLVDESEVRAAEGDIGEPEFVSLQTDGVRIRQILSEAGLTVDHVEDADPTHTMLDRISEGSYPDPFVLISMMEEERGYPMACDPPVLRS